MKNKININVNKDDQVINDYLFSWADLGFRPSKIMLYKNYGIDLYLNFLSIQTTTQSVSKDIIPLDVNDIVNERYFSKVSDLIYISFTIFDALNEEPFIGEVTLYYHQDAQSNVDDLLSKFDEHYLDDEIEEQSSQSNLFSLFISQNGFDLEPIKINESNLDNIDYYYNDDVLREVNKLSKKIKNTNKGLSIIYGERGTGKTSLINYISSRIKNKTFIFIPTTLFDVSINNPEFRIFIKKHPNSVIILDDCEIYFSDLYSKSNIFTNNLLQIVDGLDSDQLNINLLLVLNCDKEQDIDPHLLDSNNLLSILEVDYLNKNKVVELSKFLGKNKKTRESTKLVNVLKNKIRNGSDSEIGFI